VKQAVHRVFRKWIREEPHGVILHYSPKLGWHPFIFDEVMQGGKTDNEVDAARFYGGMLKAFR
jgi:hypothetical protein